MKNSNSPKKLPFFFIGKSTTDKRKENFISQKYPDLCSRLGKEDTKSIWYTREHFATLLDEIDHAGGDGIRLHFGTYEDGHKFQGQLCLVMNITRSSGVIRKDVVLESESDFEDRSAGSRSQDNTETKVPRDFNFGSPCPPRCDSD